jgi:hypothetical protein
LVGTRENTIHLKFFKTGAAVTVRVRHVTLAVIGACAQEREFVATFRALSVAARYAAPTNQTPLPPILKPLSRTVAHRRR